MKINKILSASSIHFNLEARTKKDALKQLVSKLDQVCTVNQPVLLKALLQREALGSTGIGNGIAIPHARSNDVAIPISLLAVSQAGIEFNALDGGLVYVLFLVVYPQKSVGEHLKVLAKVARLLRDSFVRDLIRKASIPEHVMEILIREGERSDTLVSHGH